MSHYCKSAIITCEDFRLHQRVDGRNYIADFIRKIKSDCDLITRGGGVQDIIRSKEKGYCSSVLRDTEVSTKLHNAKEIYLINHEDCGAYGNQKFSSKEEEVDFHYQDLKQAKKTLLEKFPDKKITLCFGYLKEHPDVFEIKELQ